ncbi:DEAD/DEAH box helicase [Proteiniphilum sp.]|uniref:DEAD/DEAH box helicase n=1 Tax=Proteiniphilum sp. TaxID=1926877 RepID=UPI002B21932E|nr:DEAD/DEAH box helicase [Proteiniphilum sp.]MEA4918459.1 DEAD/DEAH box helicase [Proteiniphilum sp.]
MNSESLIITLVLHPNFGYMLQPVFASFDEEAEVYRIVEVARPTSTSFQKLRKEEQQIVRLATSCSDRELMRSFSREKSEATFLQKISPKDIELYIRPFIEKKQGELAAIVRKMDMPLFSREKISIRDLRPSQALEVLKGPSEMVFHFSQSETFTYNVAVRNGSEDVTLYEQFFAPLAADPAIVVIGRQLHYFNDVDEKKLRPFFKKKQIEVPARSIPDYIRTFVLQCVKSYEVTGEGISIFPLHYQPTAVLTLETDFNLLPVLSLQFHYGSHRFSIDRPYTKVAEMVEEGGVLSIGWFFRDEAWERAHVSMLGKGGLIKLSSGQFSIAAESNSAEDNSTGLIEWINRNGELLKHFELKQSLGKLVYFTGEINLQVDVSDKNDWFDLHCIACFDDIRIPFAQLKEHILNGRREYVLPDGRIAVLPSVWFSRFDEMFRFGKVSSNSIRLQNTHFRVKELAENGSFSEVKTGERLLSVDLPPSLNATLRPYQENGFRWLAYLQENGFGGCLADDMGLGKTLQTITLLLYLYVDRSETDGGSMLSQMSEETRKENGIPRQLSLFDDFVEATAYNGEKVGTIQPRMNKNLPPTLIVMPTSLIHNWLNEMAKFAPQLKVYAHYGSNRLQGDHFRRKINRCQVILTSYGVVRQDIDLLSHYHFHYLVLDESQYIKNPESKIFECVKQLHSTGKLALTGTPIENSLSDLWSQMDFLNEGILGKRRAFKARFNERDVINEEESRLKLLRIIDPFILRRTKEEVAPELPPLTEETVYCEMEEEQALCYNEEKSKIRNVLLEQWSEADKSYTAAALSSLTRLRLLSNHPAISLPGYDGSSAKFDQVISQAETIFAGEHKVLIFSSFVKHLQLFAEYFDRCGWRYAWLTGSTTDRQGEIDKFNTDDDVRAFFISLKAGGTGLNLTAADYVFILDPWWNPAAEMQAVSRAHRIGQERNVTLYRFITKDTVEEKIQRLQHYKSSLSDALIKSQLSVEEIKELLE